MSPIIAIIQRNLLNFVRDKGRLLGSIVMSFFLLFIFSFVMKSSMSGLNQPMNYLIAGVIIMTVFQSSLSNSTDILSDIASGYMKEVLVSPISRYQISIGHILSGTIISIIQGAVITVISLFIGLKLDILQFVQMIVVMGIAGLAFGAIGLFLATILRNSSSFQIVSSMITMPLTFLSGAYIPITVMPKFLLPIVYINPLTYITSIFRFIVLKLGGTEINELVDLGVAFNIHGLIITPIIGLLITILIGFVFFILCVSKFSKADFSTVKVAAAPRR